MDGGAQGVGDLTGPIVPAVDPADTEACPDACGHPWAYETSGQASHAATGCEHGVGAVVSFEDPHPLTGRMVGQQPAVSVHTHPPSM